MSIRKGHTTKKLKIAPVLICCKAYQITQFCLKKYGSNLHGFGDMPIFVQNSVLQLYHFCELTLRDKSLIVFLKRF